MAPNVFLPRILRKFESQDGSLSYTPPLINFEYETEQGLLIPEVPLVGQDFSFDLLGDEPGKLENATERWRFEIPGRCSPSDIDEEMDRLRSYLYRIGRGKGWSVDSEGNRRWAYMRAVNIPGYSVVDVGEPRAAKLLAVAVDFRRQREWYDATQISVSEDITSNGENFNVTNHGNITAKNVTITFQALAAAGYTNPRVVNNTTGTEFGTSRDSASTSSRVRLQTSVPSVEHSTNSGVDYSDDFASYTLPPSGQKILSFTLAPGVNDIEVFSDGTVNFRVTITAEAPFI